MPFVNVKLVEGVFTEEQKHAMAADLTEVMVKHEGSEACRDVVWVLIEELHPDGWHIGGAPFRGPKSLQSALGHAKATYESIEGTRTSREEFAASRRLFPPSRLTDRPPSDHRATAGSAAPGPAEWRIAQDC
jgi:4-oxalocrotonate tautomerase